MRSVLLPILALALLTVSCNKQDYTPPPPEPPAPTAPIVKDGIPVVFHILYEDATNTSQNIPTQKIYGRLRLLNSYFDATSNASSTRVNIKFSIAQYDPEGNLMPEPGINRVQYPGSHGMSCAKFLKFKPTPGSINEQIFWDPHKYINIWVFLFNEDRTGISAIGPTTSLHPLGGLDQVDAYITEWPETMFGIMLNNLYFPEKEPSLLAHEMGHYFGLFHAYDSRPCFLSSYDDADDYCSDTPRYDRGAYEASLSRRYDSSPQSKHTVPLFTKSIPEEFFYRTSCAGERFLSTNIMDYYYGMVNVFTPQQRDRMEHMAKYAPLIPRADNTKAYAGFEKIEITGDKPPIRYME